MRWCRFSDSLVLHPMKGKTMTKISTRDHRAMAVAVSKGEDFQTHGALRGEAWKREVLTAWDTGRLPREESNGFMLDHLSGNLAYVIWSYDTPIGWKMADGLVIVPDVRYSRTTSCHQHMARMAL